MKAPLIQLTSENRHRINDAAGVSGTHENPPRSHQRMRDWLLIPKDAGRRWNELPVPVIRALPKATPLAGPIFQGCILIPNAARRRWNESAVPVIGCLISFPNLRAAVRMTRSSSPAAAIFSEAAKCS